MAYKNGAGTPTTDGEQAAISLAPSLGKRDAGYFQATSDPDRKVAFVVDEELAVSPSSNSQADGDKQGDEKKRNGYGEAGEGHAGNADHLPNGLMPHENVRRGLEQRHLQMLALAGAIGTGLFLGSGKALHHAGPVGMLLGYSAVSTVVIGMMMSLAEMAALAPTTGSYVRHASMWADPALGFSAGWNLAYGSAISIPGEVVSCYVLVQFWNDTISPAVFITIFALAILLSNVITIRFFGELEFGFAMLKITLIVGLIIFGLCIDLGAGPNGKRIGFRYWKDPGPFAAYIVAGSTGKFVGFWYTLVNAAYSFAGVESVAMAAAETKNPRRNIPMAARRIFIRILVFYILCLFVVTLIVPSNDTRLLNSTGTASQSPFVVAASRAGISAVAHIINAVVLTSAWSSANHGILSGSRSLYGLALDGHAPKIFLRTHRWGVPYVGVLSIAIFMTLAYMTLNTSATEVFSYFQSLTAASTLWQWIAISVTYLRLYYGMARQGIDRQSLPYKSPWQPFLGWWSLCGAALILLTGGFNLFIHPRENFKAQGFISAYASPIINIGFYVVYKLVRRTRIVGLDDMPIAPLIKDAREHPEEPYRKPRGWARIWTFLWA